jgi:hypothetical protein
MAIRPGWGQGCLRLSFLAPKRTSMAPSSICKWGPMSVEEDGHGMSWQWVILTEGPKGKSHCDQRLLLEDFAQRIQRFCPLICRFSQMGVPQDHPIIQNSLLLTIYICVCVYVYIYGKTNGLGHPHFRTPSYVFFWIRVTAPGEGHGEGEIEVTGKDEYGVYEAGGFVRGRTMTDWWISTCFNIFQPRVQESKRQYEY